MSEPFIVLDLATAGVIGSAILAGFGAMAGAMRAMWKANQDSKKATDGQLSGRIVTEKEEAVRLERLATGLVELRKSIDDGRGSMHTRFDKLDASRDKSEVADGKRHDQVLGAIEKNGAG